MKAAFHARRAFAIARKEARHVLRDPFTLGMALGLPVFLVAFFGFVIDLNVRHIRLAVSDRDKSRASRELVRMFSSSGYFDVRPASPATPLLRLLDTGRADAVLAIPPDFERHLTAGQAADAQLALDGADNSVAGVVLSYVKGIESAAQKRLTGRGPPIPITLKTRFLFNPELNSRWFVIPGLTVVILGIFSVLLTSLTIAREWENGSMELLLSTPVHPLEIVLGKLAPYIVLNLFSVALIYSASRWIFGVPFRGSHLLFGLATLVFLAAALSHGLLISVTLRQQQLAMQFGLVTGLLPALLLSGFLFPIESMPQPARYLMMLLAPTWFMEVSRGLFIKGAGLRELAPPLAMLALIAGAFMGLAVRKFKTDLEP
ncbi:MAG: ABC transporter permease [Elusimicrobia bacterium]|nr:ABC transporter permease [Elusimicrobiota bacterium]